MQENCHIEAAKSPDSPIWRNNSFVLIYLVQKVLLQIINWKLTMKLKKISPIIGIENVRSFIKKGREINDLLKEVM